MSLETRTACQSGQYMNSDHNPKWDRAPILTEIAKVYTQLLMVKVSLVISLYLSRLSFRQYNW